MEHNTTGDFFDNVMLLILNEQAFEMGIIDEQTKNSLRKEIEHKRAIS